jgi:drug/metabolite transporter (DMT)-like permease
MLSIYLRLLCVPIIWGGTFIAGRIASNQLAPIDSAIARFVFAAISLLLALQLTEGFSQVRRLTKKQWLGCFALGATGIFLYNVFFFGALKILPAGRTSMFVALNPVITVILAFVVLREKLSRLKVFGMALALLGVWTVVTQGEFSRLLSAFGKGELLMLGAVTSWATYTLISRKLLAGLSPLLATTMASCCGLLLLLFYAVTTQDIGNSWQTMRSMNANTFWSLLFLGVLGTAVAFVWYNQALKALGAAKTVVFNNLVPVFGVLQAWLILNEPLSLSLLVGGVIAIAGVFLVNRPTRQSETK